MIYHNFGWDACRELMGIHMGRMLLSTTIVIPHMQLHGAVKQIKCIVII